MSMLLTGVGSNGFSPETGVIYYREGNSVAAPTDAGWIETGLVAYETTVANPYVTYLQAASSAAGVTLMVKTGVSFEVPYQVDVQIGYDDAPTANVVQVWDGGWNADDTTVIVTPPTGTNYTEAVMNAENILGTASATDGIIRAYVACTDAPLRVASISYTIV